MKTVIFRIACVQQYNYSYSSCYGNDGSALTYIAAACGMRHSRTSTLIFNESFEQIRSVRHSRSQAYGSVLLLSRLKQRGRTSTTEHGSERLYHSKPGPHKTSSFEPLLEKAESVAVELKQLYHVSTPPAKDEDVTRVGLLFKRCLDLGRKPLKAPTHVRHTCRNPDPRARALLLYEKVDHPRRTSSTARIAAGSA